MFVRLLFTLLLAAPIGWLLGNLQRASFDSLADRLRYIVRNLAAQHGEAVLDVPATLDQRKQLVDTLTSEGQKLAELRALPADKRTDTHAQDIRDASGAIHALDAELTVLERCLSIAEDEARRNAPPESRGPLAAFEQLIEGQRSAGTQVTDRDEYRNWDGEYRSFPAFEMRTLLDSTTDGGSPGLLLNPGVPILPRPRQMRLFVRDLLSVQQTGLASVPYIRELNPTTNETGATAVAEGAAKTEVVMEWEADDAPVRKIAAWIPATMEILADAPTLRGYIDTRLAYMLKVREEAQILNGVGTAPHLKGILQFSGVQTQAAVNNDVPATIAPAIGKIELVDGDPDGIAMNPGDYWASIATRRSTFFDGDAHPTSGAPFDAPARDLWGLPVVRTRALSTLTAIVGSWRLGATLFDRMQTTIRTSDSHDDYFVKNKVAILAEERVALAVHRPDFFVNTTIDITA